MDGHEGYGTSMDRLSAFGRLPTADKQLSANQLTQLTAESAMCQSFMSERQDESSLTSSLKRGRSARNSSFMVISLIY